MDNNAILVPILTDADIGSSTANQPYTAYGQPIAVMHRAKEVDPFVDVYSLTAAGGTTTVRVWMQWSIDGINWVDISNDLVSTTAVRASRGTANTAYAEYGPLVRVNVNTSGSATGRLSVVLNVRFW